LTLALAAGPNISIALAAGPNISIALAAGPNISIVDTAVGTIGTVVATATSPAIETCRSLLHRPVNRRTQPRLVLIAADKTIASE
jgi:hypothetical protein